MDNDDTKIVRFHDIVNVILIPSIKDFENEEGEITTVWWSQEDIRKRIHRIRFEIRSYAHLENISLEDAAKKLYGLKWY